MRLALGQINPLVGDVEGNLEKIVSCIADIKDDVDLVVFPEMCLTGYPPRDLLETESLHSGVERALVRLLKISADRPDLGLLIGAPVKTGESCGAGLFNSAILLHKGAVIARRAKTLLPTYDVFDETRYFDPGPKNTPVDFKSIKLGLTVCEDALAGSFQLAAREYREDPVGGLLDEGVDLIVNISASPFHLGKAKLRYDRLSEISRKGNVGLVYVNQVGGNDELVFDGGGFVLNRQGRPIALQRRFSEDLCVVDLADRPLNEGYKEFDEVESLHGALTLGLKDYLHKCGFQRAVIGLSGGIDSAVTCSLAVDALGAENVCGVAMPSPFSSDLSLELAEKQARNLGIRFEVIPIEDHFSVFRESLRKPLSLGDEVDITLENVQARIRGALLMAFSNRQGYMLLATGNKSEVSVGYCTLYGDMSGGLAVLSDVPKTKVYELAHYINRYDEIIPQEVIERPPSAELKPNQKDQDSLPDYELLDQVLKLHVEDGMELAEIVERGFNKEQVEWVLRALHRSEYKRRQGALGIRVTTKAFGTGRRFPIAAKYGY